MPDSQNIDLMKVFTSAGVDDKQARMIIKEMFKGNVDIDLKTHLAERETLTFAKADFYAKEFGNDGFPEVETLINHFSDRLMRKRTSYNRLSRQEFIQGLISEIQQQLAEQKTKLEKVMR